MSASNETPAQKLIGDFAPKMVSLTDDVLFGDVGERAELAPRDRSLITVAALIANGNTEQLPGHLALARQNGLTETELKEVIIHPRVLRRLAQSDVRHRDRQTSLQQLDAKRASSTQ